MGPQLSDDAESAPGLTTKANGKAGAASPKLTEGESVELDDVDKDGDKLPLHEDIMQLARLGEIGPVQTLFENGKYDAKYKDQEGITPLHWAAINNHYALCKFLIESGADINAKGGESIATPAMWAAQRCHLYVVHLLLQNGADPLLTDVQGYNLLHLATFDGNVFLLIILLHENIPVDAPDPAGHTCLMWAAYHGYPAVVELFLNWGASVHGRDEKGFTALHWALVKGNSPCVHKLVGFGADRFAETNDGKTPAIVAHEMKSKKQWHHALKDHGFNLDGTPKQLPLPQLSFIRNRTFLNRFFFLCPFVLLIIVFSIMSKMPIYGAVPFTIFLSYSLQWAAQQVLLWAPFDMNHLHSRPYLAGVFAATLFWVGVRWLLTVFRTTYFSHPIYNLLLAIIYGLCTYFWLYSMTEDPGFVPKLGSRTQQKTVIDELLSLWKFDDQTFCVHCMSRMPVRSKHCKRCSRCVAKHDHHCPWIYNCVGNNNHRHFFLYVVALELGILFFLRLVVYHIESLPSPTKSDCNILGPNVCQYILRDTFTFVLAIWAMLQLVWVTMLIVTQLFLISRAQTTYESLKRSGHHHPSRAAEAITSAVTAGTTTLDGAQLPHRGMSLSDNASSAQQPKPPRKDGWFAQWKRLLGFDTFVATTTGGLDGNSRSRRRGNPFSRGLVTNCKDFWCDHAPIFGKRETGVGMLDGEVVNYSRMYENPPRMKIRRPREAGEGGVYHSVGDDDAV